MHFHLLGSGITLWTSWQISTLVGIFIGPSIPESLNLEYVIPLSFIAIVVVSINTKIKLLVFILSALFSIILKDLPWNLWIITSALMSIIIGLLIEKFRKGY